MRHVPPRLRAVPVALACRDVREVTGAEHAVNINLPHGFEYRIAEVASGTTKATGKIPLDLKQSHAHFAKINLSQNGVLDEAAA